MSKFTDTELLDWIERNHSCDLCNDGWDEHEKPWIVHAVLGGRNDREWHELGRGSTAREAIAAAMAANVRK